MYTMQREHMVNVMTLSAYILVAILQLTMPPGILPGSSEAQQYTIRVMYWTPVVGFVENLALRVSYSDQGNPTHVEQIYIGRLPEYHSCLHHQVFGIALVPLIITCTLKMKGKSCSPAMVRGTVVMIQ